MFTYMGGNNVVSELRLYPEENTLCREYTYLPLLTNIASLLYIFLAYLHCRAVLFKNMHTSKHAYIASIFTYCILFSKAADSTIT